MNLLDIPKPPPVQNARVVSWGMFDPPHKPRAKAGLKTVRLSDDDVRRIRFLHARAKRWISALDAKYKHGRCRQEIFERKRELRAEIQGRYGAMALSREYGVSPETISKIARRVRYGGVE